jgi:hypothetical protein
MGMIRLAEPLYQQISLLEQLNSRDAWWPDYF